MKIASALPNDIVPPTIINVTSATSDGTYGIGTVIPIQITFDKTVFVTGSSYFYLASTID